MRPSLLVAGVLLVAAAATLSGSSLGQSGYAVTASPAVDTPDRDVTFDNATFEVTQLGRVDPGDSVSATVSAPSGDAYDVYLYDADRDILDRHRDPSSATVFFDVPADDPNYPPGTYVIAVDHDGEFRAVTPLVIVGYDVTVSDPPSGAEPGEAVTVEASVTTVDDRKPIEQVQVVIGNDDDRQTETLSSDGDGDYSGSFTLDSLPEGEHSLYVVVQGSEEVLQRQEVLGVSDAHSFTVESGGSSDGDSSGGSSGGGSSGGSSGEQGTAEPTGTATTDSTSTTSSTSDPTETDGSTPTGSTSEGTTSPPTTSDDPVITPNPTTSAAPTTSSPGQPLGVLPVVAALLLAAALARRRCR